MVCRALQTAALSAFPSSGHGKGWDGLLLEVSKAMVPYKTLARTSPAATVPSEALGLCSSLQGFMEIPGLKPGSRHLGQTEFFFTSQKAHDKMSWPFCPISSLSLTWVAQPRTHGTCKLQATFVALFRRWTHLTLMVLDIAQTINSLSCLKRTFCSQYYN